MTLPYPPPWMDLTALCAHICATPNTVESWVAKGILPPPRKRGGKLMWKYSEVDRYLTDGAAGGSPDKQAEEITDGTRRAAAEARGRH